MQIDTILQEFKNGAHKIYGDRLKAVLLYGSWAQGSATNDSDIDLAVVLKGQVIPGKEIDRLIDIITDINLKYGVLLSVYPVSEQNYKALQSPLLINLRSEGVAV